MKRTGICIAVALVLGGCSSLPGLNVGNLHFAATPSTAAVSTAWRDADDVLWVVPRKGQIIDGFRSPDAHALQWEIQGSYIRVFGAGTVIEIASHGRWLPMQAPVLAEGKTR